MEWSPLAVGFLGQTWVRFFGRKTRCKAWKRIVKVLEACEKQWTSYLNICERNKIFSIHLKGIDSFQRKGGSAVIWAGVDKIQPLTVLQSQLEDKLMPMGFAQEKRFIPHLTLGRTKALDDRVHFRQTLEKYRDLNFGTMTVSALSLMKSDLKPEGPVYTRLYHFPLTEER